MVQASQHGIARVVVAITKPRSIAITTAGMAVVVTAIVAYLYLWQSRDIFSHALIITQFFGFWLFAWQLDARFTARNWQYVMKGHESNIIVNAIARHVTCGSAWPTLVLHAAFTFTVACTMAAVVVSVVPIQMPVAAPAPTPVASAVLASAFLALFGTGHLDAYIDSKEFVASCHTTRQK